MCKGSRVKRSSQILKRRLTMSLATFMKDSQWIKKFILYPIEQKRRERSNWFCPTCYRSIPNRSLSVPKIKDETRCCRCGRTLTRVEKVKKELNFVDIYGPFTYSYVIQFFTLRESYHELLNIGDNNNIKGEFNTLLRSYSVQYFIIPNRRSGHRDI